MQNRSIRRIISHTGTGTVAAIAGVVSYSHMRELALHTGQPAALATILPLSVDGMMIVATIALTDGRQHKAAARVAFWLGVVASLAANLLASRPDLEARLVSVWPAVALLATIEVIARSGVKPAPKPRAPRKDPKRVAAGRKGAATVKERKQLAAAYAMPSAPVSPAP
ncbi:MAG TPA: DUF2637 domain-containing protein [Micromonosporaceae bacterium]|jgi:hypothetical protein|nr:DUF2637 domain-containing protein [Micromonosporaceae bacterium]